MYNPPICNEYIPFEYPSIEEYIPTQEYSGFQWNPVPTSPESPLQGDFYDIILAGEAFQAGVPYRAIIGE